MVHPMAAHVCWAAFLYVLLTVVRAPTAWGIGRRADGSNPWAAIEPRVSANLRNQFEWPLLFYVACLYLVLGHANVDPIQLWFAWIFVAGRVVHTAVQIVINNVRLRGLVFTINFVAVLGMWANILWARAGS